MFLNLITIYPTPLPHRPRIRKFLTEIKFSSNIFLVNTEVEDRGKLS